ncbi:hypothetical protein ACMFMG_000846 [Clarireedia jacksonii]
MNNDPSTTVPGPSDSNQNERSRTRRRRRQTRTPAQRRFEAQMQKKYELTRLLMSNLDLSVYAQLCALYYMDCSLFQLLLRGMSQFVILTPKPPHVRQPPQSSSWVTILVGSNLLCIFLHLLLSPPKASEEMRGYLHGGVIIDLIGQKGPSSRLKLVLFDLIVLVLQTVMFSIHIERERIGKILVGYLKKTPDVPPPSTQDHDAEERGVLRDHVTSAEDIEMQTLDSAGLLSPSRSRVDVSEGDEAIQDLLAEPDGDENDDTPLDIFWSGTAVIGDFNVIDTLRSQLAVSAHGSGTESQPRSMFADASRRSNAIARSLRRGLNS